MSITFDYELMVPGISLSEGLDLLRPYYLEVQAKKKAGEYGFTALPYQSEAELGTIKALAEEVRSQFKTIIIVGIGGSDLGARAAHRALNHQFYNLLSTPRLFFAGDTTDPVALQEVLDVVDLKESVVVVISKSGNTIEQMSTFVYLRQCLIEACGADAVKNQVVMVTDASGGSLREIANREGCRSLVIPAKVGGRFSIFSSVGLFPLALVGIDIGELLAGARAMDEHDSTTASEQNIPALYALLQYLHYPTRPISVMMPYTYGLREFGFWFRQIWAESLGKKYDLSGSEVHSGPTPIAAVGPTDQHSQVQLYMEGPDNKVFTFVTVENTAQNIQLPEAYPDLEGVHYLKGHSFQEILLAEERATAFALAEAGRPSCCIHLSELNAFTFGQLMYLYEMATTYAGALFQINTFDQPGVEIGKEYMYTILGRSGFTERSIPEPSHAHTLTI